MAKTISSRDSWDLIGTLSKGNQTDAAIALLKALIIKTVLLMRFPSEPIEALEMRLPSEDLLKWMKQLDEDIERIAKEGRFDDAYKLFETYLKLIARLSNVSSLALRSKMVGGVLHKSVQAQAPMKMTPVALKRRRRVDLEMKLGGLQEGIIPESRMDTTPDKGPYYSTFDVAEKLGVSPQTVRRMCEYGKFPGAIRTDGGHWRIPQDLFKTTKEQDEKAEAALRQLDKKFTDTGEFDEFDL